VDPVALGIPDYPKIIKKPMDYGTIHTRLDRREYRTAEDCLNDILQVSRNAKMFNPPGAVSSQTLVF
jgi:bromodomain-containing factor 1